MFVPDSWTHAVLNLQDTVGAAVEYMAFSSSATVRMGIKAAGEREKGWIAEVLRAAARPSPRGSPTP